jgi:uncharacterized protein (DUF362 family)
MTPPGQGFREDQGSISSEFGHKIIAKKRQFIKNNIMIYSYKLAVFNLYTVTTTMTMSVANFISFLKRPKKSLYYIKRKAQEAMAITIEIKKKKNPIPIHILRVNPHNPNVLLPLPRSQKQRPPRRKQTL